MVSRAQAFEGDRRLQRVGRAAAAATGFAVCMAASGLPASAAGPDHAAAMRFLRHADFAGETASAAARSVADWALASGDHGGLPFLIVDKVDARVFVFDARGGLLGTAAALLGAARGDDTVPGIGERAISTILPHERTTPAGRFVAEPGRNTHGEDIIWVDYDAAVSLHRVRATDPKERRLQRLRTPSAEDNRISYGCINVPASFYDRIITPALRAHRAIVYVLPETRTAQALFGMTEPEVAEDRSKAPAARAQADR